MAGHAYRAPRGGFRSSPEEKEPPNLLDEEEDLLLRACLGYTTTPSPPPISIATSNSTATFGTQELFVNAREKPFSASPGSSSETTTANPGDHPASGRGSCTSTQHSTHQMPTDDHLDHHGCENIEQHSHGDSSPPSHSHSSLTCCSTAPILREDGTIRPQDCSKDHSDTARQPTTFERVVLTIDGLKCGCCEGGVSRAVGNITEIKNHQVNVVLARVEFDLDTSRLSVADVITKLNGATGYTFEEHTQPEGQILELLVSDPVELYRAGRPYGVTLLDTGPKKTWSPARLLSGRNSTMPSEASALDQPASKSSKGNHKTNGTSLYAQTVRVHYDATQIGARDVFEYYQQLAPNQNLQLAPPAAHQSLAIGAKQTKKACIVFLMTLALTIPVLVLAWAPINHEKMAYAYASLALASIVQIIATKEFVPGALRALFHSGLFEMDFLIALSTTTAYVFSVVSFVFLLHKQPLETGSFFETSTLLVTLIFLGRVVSEFARLRAAKSVSFRSLQAEDVLLILTKPQTGPFGETHKIDVRLLQYGDSFKVPPHTRIVTDGKVTYGGSEVDESMITGESVPVAKGLGHKVFAGTTNGSGQLIVALTALPHENSISKIAMMVENAELTKPKAQALADRVAGWFVPAIAAISLAVFLIWMLVDHYHSHRLWRKAVVRAITYAIATLVVSCPCAIGLAVPMVVLIAGGVSARFGIIFRDPQKLEVARSVTDLVFDKTGTLTTGNLTVVEGQFHGSYPNQVKSMLFGLLEDVKHPVAAAVLKWLQNESSRASAPIRPTKMVDITSIPGEGVMGICKESRLEVRAGNPQWLGVTILESNHTLLCVTVSGVLSATFRLEDQSRRNAENVVKLLGDRGLTVHMISGDSEGAVKNMAYALNISKVHTRSRLKPKDKQRYIRDLQVNGAVVMFVGDGTNDSVALKQADVGVHVNHGSDVAKSASDVVLMTTRLHDILVLIDISKAAYRRIVLNFAWSAIYNVLAILLAAGAFVKIRIEPAWAGLGELVSVLPVVLIAFQMRWRNYGREYRAMEYDAKSE
ncbi:E1-E2 ATPase-domain-containing protein [Massariosphaeria phaeospora]|uniref:E1-E2 ATPase-domain-containing protein n=1 Tax=Massariosphaeria phaeospora TaxID=100035 RepID=A0A7C8MTE4_9PLEO|nr:E1-E2 ATPase-domain-containing protein [Massariosphaeria phaeospora]